MRGRASRKQEIGRCAPQPTSRPQPTRPSDVYPQVFAFIQRHRITGASLRSAEIFDYWMSLLFAEDDGELDNEGVEERNNAE